jgi:hypothetical protein
MKHKNKLTLFSLIFLILTFNKIQAQVYTVGTGQTYTTLKAAFDAINAGSITGAITLQINANCAETVAAVLNASGTGSASYTSINIYPTGATRTISGSIDGGPGVDGDLILLNGADNVTIDGRLNGSGTPNSLILVNTFTDTYACTVTMKNSAENNTVRYCTLKGSGTSGTATGIINIGTSSSGNGCDNTTISNCSITADAAGRPYNAILLNGTLALSTDNVLISDNLIYDVFSNVASSNAINIYSGITTATISGNSIYETTTLTGGSGNIYYGIYNGSVSGFDGTILNNNIGGTAANCGGTAFTMDATTLNTFGPIYIGTGSCSIQGNVIRNISWTTNATGASSFYGIQVSVPATKTISIGNITGNVIGSTTANGDISVTNTLSATFSTLYGIYSTMSFTTANAGSLDIQNNTISGITATGDATSSSYRIYGIHLNSLYPSATATISNNLIGSTTQSNSLYANSSASTASDQEIRGINIASGNATAEVVISGNTIANITNAYNNTAGAIWGIKGIRVATSGKYTITNNIINNLSSSCGGTSSGVSASVIGILLQSTSAVVQTVSGNVISNIANVGTGNVATKVIGIVVSAGTGPNIVEQNFIYGLSDISTSTTAQIVGINILAGTTTFANNIVSLTFASSGALVYGISDAGATSNLYHNTVSLSGTVTAGTTVSNALISSTASNRDIRNNIFSNTRSGGGTHNAVNLSVTTLTVGYNDYVGSLVGITLNTAPDNNSTSASPSFSAVGGSTPLSYYPATVLTGSTGIGITGDYYGNTRTLPKMGALEANIALPISLLHFSGKKVGTKNKLYWATATELNNDYFVVEKSTTGEKFKQMAAINGAGNSTSLINYSVIDENVDNTINYYRLKQVDFDGSSTFSEIISIDNSVSFNTKKIISITNLLGQQIADNYNGMVIILYSDGSSEKKMQYN